MATLSVAAKICLARAWMAAAASGPAELAGEGAGEAGRVVAGDGEGRVEVVPEQDAPGSCRPGSAGRPAAAA